MDELRRHLERRRTILRSLFDPSPVLESLLAHGTAMETPTQPWTEAERRLSALIARLVRFRPAQCYANAQQAVLLASRLGSVAARHTLEYWEGFAYLPVPAPFAHGWCVLNGRVWDLSMEHLGHNIGIGYLGMRIPSSYIKEAMIDRRTYAPLLHQWLRRLNGVDHAPVEPTGCGLSSLRARGGLAGAPSRV